MKNRAQAYTILFLALLACILLFEAHQVTHREKQMHTHKDYEPPEIPIPDSGTN